LESDRDWHSQVRQELISLQKNAPGSVADVAEAIQAVAKLIEPLTGNHQVALKVEPVPPNLTAAIHPSVLHQLLITAVEKLVQQMVSGQITLKAERVGDRISLTISGDPIGVAQPPDSAFIREILSLQGGTVERQLQGHQVSFQVELPAARKVTVLVVDDNADLIHFYRRYLTGTRYQIVHIAEGQNLLERVGQIAPDIIVLDVMLPDMDGWELLTQLREDPLTQTTPIVVCSVVRREELALALGAAAYLSKPVRRQQFIQALEQLQVSIS
jgi:CheY-like chemotaxis protein